MPERLRVACFNFLSGGSRRRRDHWSRLLDAVSPDVILAQECRPPEHWGEARFLPREDDAFLWQGAGSRGWGTALWARDARLSPVRVPDFDGWVVGGDLELESWRSRRPLRVFSLHGPAGAHGYIRTMHEILDRLAPLRDGADLILGGDFNVVVGHRGSTEPIKVSRGETGLLTRLAEEFDLIPCWQTANPGLPLAQTLRWTANRLAPYHCDGLFIPSGWREYLTACRVVSGPEWDELSDHNPVVVQLEKETERDGMGSRFGCSSRDQR